MSGFRPFFTAHRSPKALRARDRLISRYDQQNVADATHIIPIGGDGFMLYCLRKFQHLRLPFYGINRGRIGFLTNFHDSGDLASAVANAVPSVIEPLFVACLDTTGKEHRHIAYNEVSLFRKSSQSAHIAVAVNGKTRLDTLICDGIMVATPAGSTAYNFSAHGPILPLNSRLLALTPISPYRPRKWAGALLPIEAVSEFTVLHPYKRPVSLAADNVELPHVQSCRIRLEPSAALRLLFNNAQPLEERILNEQFPGLDQRDGYACEPSDS